MSNIKRVTIELSNPMADRVREALAAGAFSTTQEAIHRAARRWSAASQRRPPVIEAPGIAEGEPAAPQIAHHSR
jgi:Arc/MetJ-type ribon-helix-helix transcriptional regulator